VKSAVLLAGLGATSPTTVHEPAPTRAHTEEMLAACGADITVTNGGSTVRVAASPLRPFDLEVPGDPSQAAFWIVAACTVPDSDVTIEGVYVGRARATFLDVLARMGADVTVVSRGDNIADVRARFSTLVGTVVAGAEIAGLIDEIPALAVAGATASGVTEFRDAGELRVKESDRIATLVQGLGALGASVDSVGDGLRIRGGTPLRGATVDAHGDHRIAMALAVTALRADGPTRVEGWSAVATSYPSFVRHLEDLRA
jgi:3-phosphoshikimate 1-carboxyvinyltransferase